MRRVIFLALLLLVVISPSSAEDGYLLRQPSAEEYLAAIIEIASHINEPANAPFYHLIEPANKILLYLYPDSDEISFDLLFEAYTEIGIGRRDLLDRGAWIRRMVVSWITENEIDLSQTDTLEFEDFYITVIPRDFNADGTDEYLLDIMKGQQVDRHTENCQQAEIIDYLLAQKTADGYRYIETKIPWRGQQDWIYSGLDGGIVELRFEDLNADGLPEWVVLEGGGFAGGMGMGSADVGELLILGWRDDGLAYLTPTEDGMISTAFLSTRTQCEGPYPRTVDWEFTNIDDDDALEILQSQRFADNWLCGRTETKIFDWHSEADRYLYLETHIEYADHMQNCAQRDAEELMWTGDYQAAIPIFERALTLKTLDLTPDQFFSYVRSLNQYLRARLAFAYMMTEQGDLAIPLLDTLRAEEVEEIPIGLLVEMLSDLQSSAASPLEICVTVYNLFTENFPQIRVGYTGDDLYSNTPYLPENIGCAAPDMLGEVLDSAEIPVTTSPIDYLAGLGISVLKSLETDMNTDGLSEWLIWPDVAGVEVFFAPDEDNYKISYPKIDPFFRAETIREITLPDNSGTAVAVMHTALHSTASHPLWNLAYAPFAGALLFTGSCNLSDETQSPITSIELWRIDDNSKSLSAIFLHWHCGDDLEAVFPQNTGAVQITLKDILCADDDMYCTESTVQEIVFNWDTIGETYIAPPMPTPQSHPTQTPAPTSTPRPYPYYYSVLRAFELRDFNAVVGMTAEPATANQEINDVLRDRYLRALALEALGRPDEALAEYIAIYEASPESAWGILAAVHFEVIDGE